MKGLLYRLRLVMTLRAKPGNEEAKASRLLVTRYARGNLNLKRGRYLTKADIDERRALLAKCRF